MRLPAVSRGSITLYAIDYQPDLSNETFAFTATIEYAGYNARVDNPGDGSPNVVHSEQLTAAIDGYARMLPSPVAGLPLTGDALISLLVGEAIEKHEQQQQERAQRARLNRAP